MPHVVIDGYSLRFRERGGGPVAILVHGFPLDSTLWLDQIDGLCDIRRVVAPDLRGFGRSGPSSGPLGMERHADDLAVLADHLGADAVDLVGLSMGGYVALAFGERHGDRLRSLVLADTKATADDDRARANRDLMAMRAVVQGRSALATEMLETLLSAGASPRAKGRLRTMVEGTPVESIVAALEAMRDRPDRTAVLSGLTVPVSVLVGAEDRLTGPGDAENLAASVSGAVPITVVPGAGHLPPIEAPEAVTAAIRRAWT